MLSGARERETKEKTKKLAQGKNCALELGLAEKLATAPLQLHLAAKRRGERQKRREKQRKRQGRREESKQQTASREREREREREKRGEREER